ncbi:MAG: peroxiredoxin [Arenicella sp.]
MINIGDSIPAVDITAVYSDSQETVSAATFFAGKKVVMFALPGAFTPTCSQSHLPGYVVKADEFKAKGIDAIACLSVNDSFVMKAWQEQQNAENIVMVADGSAALSKALGLEMDTAGFGGVRSQRYAMIVDNGVVTQLNVEKPQAFEVSDAESMLALLG